MVTIICSRSGLSFQAENRRTKVHPGISRWTACSDWKLRQKASEVIERGKSEGWNTLEKFEVEIQKVLNPPPPPEPDYDFEGVWAARLVGSHDKFRFEREFIPPVSVNGRFKRFNVSAAGDGLFETCYKSAKGNETRHYYRVQGGRLEQISLPQAEEAFPLADSALLKVEEWFPKGKNVVYEGIVYSVDRCDSWEAKEDIWDDIDDEWTRRSVTKSVSFLRPLDKKAADLFLAEKIAEEAQRRAQEAAVAYLQKTILAVFANKNVIAPPHGTLYPSGLSFTLEEGYYQPNFLAVLRKDGKDYQLWTLRYNGRDGDDWRPNNAAGAWVGRFASVSPEFAERFQEIAAIAKGEACHLPGLSCEDFALESFLIAAEVVPTALAEECSQEIDPPVAAMAAPADTKMPDSDPCCTSGILLTGEVESRWVKPANKPLSKGAQNKVVAQFRRESREIKRAVAARVKEEREKTRQEKNEAKRSQISQKGGHYLGLLASPDSCQSKKLAKLRKAGTYAADLSLALRWLDAQMPAVAARIREGDSVLQDAAVYYLTQIERGVNKFFACCVAMGAASSLSVRQEARTGAS